MIWMSKPVVRSCSSGLNVGMTVVLKLIACGGRGFGGELSSLLMGRVRAVVDSGSE